ncbi:hypothetical protein LEP1GSC193_2301 [Leptospira alstonii serovar Pingchang str. 80-412]|uniref:Uncharacterized protein n=2 Tax=Leptospira alstonii TaxID=28452 RepID=M6CSC4_9LEPT|nr:hypothetical protein LEP1GSC194_3126 [Leptospira alstonii serovar Sichuan str. 79601]EQA80892.1 hypothetical protein LEP1GSC193_2301 [Leptospira alstonii serovar Pingchang str. 80-412]
MKDAMIKAKIPKTAQTARVPAIVYSATNSKISKLLILNFPKYTNYSDSMVR